MIEFAKYVFTCIDHHILWFISISLASSIIWNNYAIVTSFLINDIKRESNIELSVGRWRCNYCQMTDVHQFTDKIKPPHKPKQRLQWIGVMWFPEQSRQGKYLTFPIYFETCITTSQKREYSSLKEIWMWGKEPLTKLEKFKRKINQSKKKKKTIACKIGPCLFSTVEVGACIKPENNEEWLMIS